MRPNPLIVLGHPGPSGVYILRIQVQQRIEISLGRFKQGQPVAFAPGEYLYLGSALGVQVQRALRTALFAMLPVACHIHPN